MLIDVSALTSADQDDGRALKKAVQKKPTRRAIIRGDAMAVPYS
jgi:hypothetical protein